jgi:hydrogenase maturation protease
MPVTICGIGQWFRGDDAVGLAIVDRWQQIRNPDANIDVHLITAPASQLPNILLLSNAIILVDAITSNQPAGHITVIRQMDQLDGNFSHSSSHGFGVCEIIQMIMNLPAQMNKRIVFIGMEAQQFALGEPISSAVEKSIPDAMKQIDTEAAILLLQGT